MFSLNLVLKILAFAISCIEANWQDRTILNINLARFRNNNVDCTGVLYRDDVVLTSAFCADNLKRNSKITLNMPGSKPSLVTFKVVSSIYYPEYDGDFKNPIPKTDSRTNDLGIILINTEEDLPTSSPKFKITNDYLSSFTGSTATIFAWKEVSNSKDKLKFVSGYDRSYVLKKEYCRSENLKDVKGSFWLRTRASTRSQYTYDLGSPVFSYENGKIFLVGIVSEVVYREEGPKFLGTTEIYKMHDWIEDKITHLVGPK